MDNGNGSKRNRDLARELDADSGDYPESWKPKVGEQLVGRVVRYDTGQTKFGRAHICVIEDEQTGALRSVWLLAAVLLGEFREQRPKPGERIGVKRHPDAEKGYQRFRVLVDRGDTAAVPDFEEFGPTQDEIAAETHGESLERGEEDLSSEVPF